MKILSLTEDVRKAMDNRRRIMKGIDAFPLSVRCSWGKAAARIGERAVEDSLTDGEKIYDHLQRGPRRS